MHAPVSRRGSGASSTLGSSFSSINTLSPSATNSLWEAAGPRVRGALLAADATRGGSMTADRGGRMVQRNSVFEARQARASFARAESAVTDAHALEQLLTNSSLVSGSRSRPTSSGKLGLSPSRALLLAEEEARAKADEAALAADAWSGGIGGWSGGFGPRGKAALQRRLEPLRPDVRSRPPPKSYLIQKDPLGRPGSQPRRGSQMRRQSQTLDGRPVTS